MKTVGEFKKAGLVFVNGDVYCHKGSTLKMLADGITLKWFERDAKALNATITGFAWRENTGVKPKFSGFIDFTHKDGTEYFSQKVGSRHCSEWGIVGGANQIAKWRPSLNQPSFSEPETKQSAIHKAWVDLKGDLSNAEKHDSGGRFLVVCIKDGIPIKKGEYQIASHKKNNTEYWENVCTIQEFTDYCEKMAAEEKRMDIICQNGNEGLHYDNTAQQVEVIVNNNTPFSIELAEKGGFSYEFKAAVSGDKPIFTQAMADAGELPPVGSFVLLKSDRTGTPENLNLNEHCVIDCWGKGSNLEVIAHTDIRGCILPVVKFDNQVSAILMENIEPLGTRTDREKAIDEMLKDSRCNGSVIEICIERLYDAGYRKC